MTASWRDLSMSWHRQHAPLTSYERLVRASISEMRPEERAAIRRDVQRSQCNFTQAPWSNEEVDSAAHCARLERVLCAWTQYDQEIGYVQAMNLVSSTLLLLLDGDEEAAFWSLVQLIRQLPPQFYARAPLPLLGFWAEVEVLSQLAHRLLGLGNVRLALLQAAPSWLLSFWVGVLPLELIVMIWDVMLRNGNATTPSVLPLQVGLVLLKTYQPHLEEILGDAADPVAGAEASGANEMATHQAFTVLQSIRVPDASAGMLLQHAQRLRLNDAAVQDMRLQLRIAIEERCLVTNGQLPCSDPLPEAGSKPIPLLQPARVGMRGRLRRVCCSAEGASHLLSLTLTLGALFGSLAVWGSALRHDPYGTDWEVLHLDILLILCLSAVGVAVGCRWRAAQPAVAVGSCLITIFLGARAVDVLIGCAKQQHAAALRLTENGAADDCRSLAHLWPILVCALALFVAILQVSHACAVHRRGGASTALWPTGDTAADGSMSTDDDARVRRTSSINGGMSIGGRNSSTHHSRARVTPSQRLRVPAVAEAEARQS